MINYLHLIILGKTTANNAIYVDYEALLSLLIGWYNVQSWPLFSYELYTPLFWSCFSGFDLVPLITQKSVERDGLKLFIAINLLRNDYSINVLYSVGDWYEYKSKYITSWSSVRLNRPESTCCFDQVRSTQELAKHSNKWEWPWCGG